MQELLPDTVNKQSHPCLYRSVFVEFVGVCDICSLKGMPFDVYSCSSPKNHATCSISPRRKDTQACTRCPDRIPYEPRTPIGPSVAITTSPRAVSYLAACVVSVKKAGATNPIVYAEPESRTEEIDTTIVHRQETLGCWRNWVATAEDLLKGPGDLLMIIQDDTLLSVNAFDIQWPDRDDVGFVSLYTPKHYTKEKDGLHPVVTKSLWGACAMIFERDKLRAILDHPIAKTWKGAGKKVRNPPPEKVKNIDTAIGKVCNALGLKMFFHSPSLAQHIGAYSSIGHGGLGGRREASRVAADLEHAIRQPSAPCNGCGK